MALGGSLPQINLGVQVRKLTSVSLWTLEHRAFLHPIPKLCMWSEYGETLIGKGVSWLVNRKEAKKRGCPAHAPNTKLFRPTVAILRPLMTIRHCTCKATVSCASEVISSTEVSGHRIEAASYPNHEQAYQAGLASRSPIGFRLHRGEWAHGPDLVC
ncbi:hypothetical protein TNCV_3506751 [Trichonephila clavipes]|uniref:Uncharacterized protein n=1 Tax=Trichonephila clavipes TaxID=2585209 RepID=A0A8X6VE53_TRICX|nr:hypothetical protein TNCV_3506751 [Trichonephila clavipes]